MRDTVRRLRHVLAGQRFPADRWELVIGAEHDGADAVSLAELQALPLARFASLDDVLIAVDRSRHATGSA